MNENNNWFNEYEGNNKIKELNKKEQRLFSYY